MPDDPLSQNPPPSEDEIAAALRSVMTRGLRATRADDEPLLSSLHAVRRLALVDDDVGSLTAALHSQVRELMRGVRRNRLRRLAPFAFGTYTVDDLPLSTRLTHAYQNGIGWSPQTARKQPLTDLSKDMAHALHWLESRLRYNQWLDKPFDEALHDQTLRQYDFFSAMSFWLNGAALDLEAALNTKRDGEEGWPAEWAYSALWRWTRFLRASDRFNVEFNGVWALVRLTDDEMHEAMRAEYDAQVLAPLTPTERSQLRVELLTTYQEELAPFRAALERTPTGRTIVAKWINWLDGCSCPNGEVGDKCEIHRFIAEAQTFFELMNKEIGEPHRTDRAARFQTLPDVYEP